MDVAVLSASQPIVKRYDLTPRGRLKKESYPHLSRFTSYKYPISNLRDLYTVITEHAKVGHCLLKGELQRDLEAESRAGATSPDSPTQWICLDLDGITCFQDVEHALATFGCNNTDYILQWSASQGIDGNNDIRCHIFMLLHASEHPATLKRWLKYLNLTTELKNELKLTATGNSLSWPLDITTCQNDKLLYISPPVFGDGVNDPFDNRERIEFCERKYRRLELDLSSVVRPDQLKQLEIKTLNKLRKTAGLRARKAVDTKLDTNVEYMVNPDVAEVTGRKTERGFTYFNLNGGDSWGYYHPVDNPAFIYNFKGEPTYRTQDLLPSYWAEVKARVQKMEPDAGGNVYLAFRDFDTATYWNGIYSNNENRLLKLAQARSEAQLRHFMKQHGQPLGDFIPDWDMKFDPHAPYVLDQKNKKLNTYQRSKYFARKPNFLADPPPKIAEVIFHVMGSEHGVYEHFLNWLAVIVQNLKMTGTAWVLHGAQGTGKGVLFNHILTPLFGKENVTSRRMEELGSNFTEFMKDKFIVFIDEVSSGKTLYHDKIASKLKNLIVEPRISVREMYKPSQVMKNYTNLIFASNAATPVAIAPDDRRFNVGTRQELPIKLSSSDIDTIESEVGDFYDYLCSRPADVQLARKPCETADRARIINNSRPAIEIAIEALKFGDLQFFREMKMVKPELINTRMQLVYDQYVSLIEEIEDSKRTRLSREDLMTIFRWCVDSVPDSPNKFTALMRHHGVEMEVIWLDNRSVRGIEIEAWEEL